MDKAEIKAREDEIVKMTVCFCNEKIDAEYASLCIKMIRKPSRKKALLKFIGSVIITIAAAPRACGFFCKSFQNFRKAVVIATCNFQNFMQ